jgi:PAS domain S-box-containing protein
VARHRDVIAGMARAEYGFELRRYDGQGWRAIFCRCGRPHKGRGTFLALHVVGDAAITTRGLSNGSAALPERLRARLARADDGVWVTTNDGRIAFWNRSAETSLGFRAQEVCGRSCADLLTGCDECGRPICGPGCDAGAGVPKSVGRNFGIPTYTKDGRKVWLEVMTFTTNGNESPPFVIHVFHDATRTKQLLRDLREHIDDASADAERLTPRELEVAADDVVNSVRLGHDLSVSRREIVLELRASAKHIEISTGAGDGVRDVLSQGRNADPEVEVSCAPRSRNNLQVEP